MVKLRRIKSSGKRRKLLLLFVLVSILFISCGYAIVNSNLGFLGTLFVNHYENQTVIQAFSMNDKTKFRSDTYREKIETITLSDSINPPSNYEESWNLGVNNKSGVKGYIVKRNGTETDVYDLYIQGDGSLYANPDSSYLFYNLNGLKQIINLSTLNTSYVTDMTYMFGYCSSLESLDVSRFDTSKVTNMSSLFYYCSNLTSLDIAKFNTNNVKYMGDMFSNCSGLTSLDLGKLITSKVIYMNHLFYKCSSLTSLDVSHFDTSNVISMGSMFSGCRGLTGLDVSNFNTKSVTNMGFMFFGCERLTNLNVSKFDTSKVTDMVGMFDGCSSLTSLDVSHFDTSNVTRIDEMFEGCSSLTSLDVGNFNTSNVTHMYQMFSGCSGLTSLDVSHFDTSNVVSIHTMFSGCRGLTSLDLSNFDTSKVTLIGSMFYNCSKLTTIYVGPKWSVASVTSSTNMFSNCSKLVGQSGVAYNSSKVDVTMANYETGYLTYYTTKIYTINYNLDGGSVSGNPNSYTTYTNTFTLKEPTKVGYKFKGWLDEQDNLYYKEPYNERYNLTFGDNYFILNQNIEGNSINSFRVNLSTLDGLTYIDTIAYSSIEYFSTVYSFVAETGDYLLYLNANTNKSDGGLVVGMHFIKGEKYVISWHKVYGNAQEYKIENFKIYRQGGSEVSVPVGTIPRGSIGNRSFRALWEAA